MENQQENQDMENLSPEELAARKEQMLQFYTESLKYLEAQLKYETVLTDIDECRFKRAQIQVQYAMMMESTQNPNPNGGILDEDDESELPQEGRVNPETVSRKLKKQ